MSTKCVFTNYFVWNQVDSSYTTSGRESRNTYTFAATTEDNNARYRCESVNELSAAPHNAEIVLSVQCKFTKTFRLNTVQRSANLLFTGVNFINILLALFSPIFWRQKISNPKHSFVIFGAKILSQNVRVKCWWNWHQITKNAPKFISFRLLVFHFFAVLGWNFQKCNFLVVQCSLVISSFKICITLIKSMFLFELFFLPVFK